MFDVHDATGDVAVNYIQSEVQRFRTETKGEVDLDEKVDEAGTHVPPNLGLLVHGGSGGHGALLVRVRVRVCVSKRWTWMDVWHATYLHVVHVPENVVTILLLEKTRVADLRDELRFAETLKLGDAWGATEGGGGEHSVCRGAAGLGDAAIVNWGRTLLGVDGQTGCLGGGVGDVLHI